MKSDIPADDKFRFFGEILAFYVSPIDSATVYNLARIVSDNVAEGEGTLHTSSGSKPYTGATKLRRHDWAEQVSPSGLVTLTANDWTAKREHRRQLRCFCEAERILLAVLRGAHMKVGNEIEYAMNMLGLGSYTLENHLIRNLLVKGYVSTAGRKLYVYSVNREWVTRPSPFVDGEAEIKWEAWAQGTPTRSNPLYSGTEWWEVVDWPRFRGGRPPAPRGEG